MTKKEGDVWIVNNSGHDFSPAYEYGDNLYYLTNGRVNIFKTHKVINEIKGKMQNFRKDDWLLLSGNSILCVIAVQVALAMYGQVKVLIYNAITGSYAKAILDEDKFKGGVHIGSKAE